MGLLASPRPWPYGATSAAVEPSSLLEVDLASTGGPEPLDADHLVGDRVLLSRDERAHVPIEQVESVV